MRRHVSFSLPFKESELTEFAGVSFQGEGFEHCATSMQMPWAAGQGQGVCCQQALEAVSLLVRSSAQGPVLHIRNVMEFSMKFLMLGRENKGASFDSSIPSI